MAYKTKIGYNSNIGHYISAFLYYKIQKCEDQVEAITENKNALEILIYIHIPLTSRFFYCLCSILVFIYNNCFFYYSFDYFGFRAPSAATESPKFAQNN